VASDRDTGFDASLAPGERLLWAGRPDPTTYLFATRAPTMILAGSCWLLAVTGRLFGFPDVTDRAGFAETAGLLSSVFAFAAVILCALLIYIYVRASYTTFALTDRRALLVTRFPFARVHQFAATDIRFLAFKAHGDSFTDVLFATRGVRTGGSNILLAPDGFHAIPDAREVARLIRVHFLIPRKAAFVGRAEPQRLAA